MKVIQLSEIHPNVEEAIARLRVVEKPMPTLKHGEVLIKIGASPCNPSDLLFLQGVYGVKKSMPAVPGWEGAGTVVGSGGGLLGSWLKGKRVACGGQGAGDGTWAEYYVAPARNCIPLRKEVPMEQGATLLVNPLTAYGMVDLALRNGHRGLVQTAAASQVGRMVARVARSQGTPCIHIVRRPEQVAILKEEGAEYVLDSSADGFLEELRALATKLHATALFEAVAGSLTGQLLRVLPKKAEAYVYGSLSLKPCSDIDALSLIFQSKRVRGFWLTEWLAESKPWAIWRASSTIQKWMEEGSFATTIRAAVGFEEFLEELPFYHHEMTSGKVLLTPQDV